MLDVYDSGAVSPHDSMVAGSAPKDGVGFPIVASAMGDSSSSRTLELSAEDLKVLSETATATESAIPAGGAAPPASTGTSDDDDSSWGGRSEAENPGALRRSGSNSSISTLDSTSTGSSTWPGSVGFVTPARTDIPRGGGSGRPSGRGRGHASSASTDSFSSGFRTPASHAAATPGRVEPDTPSPRSGSGSAHGTPHVSRSFGRVGVGGWGGEGFPLQRRAFFSIFGKVLPAQCRPVFLFYFILFLLQGVLRFKYTYFQCFRNYCSFFGDFCLFVLLHLYFFEFPCLSGSFCRVGVLTCWIIPRFPEISACEIFTPKTSRN